MKLYHPNSQLILARSTKSSNHTTSCKSHQCNAHTLRSVPNITEKSLQQTCSDVLYSVSVPCVANKDQWTDVKQNTISFECPNFLIWLVIYKDHKITPTISSCVKLSWQNRWLSATEGLWGLNSTVCEEGETVLPQQYWSAGGANCVHWFLCAVLGRTGIKTSETRQI